MAPAVINEQEDHKIKTNIAFFDRFKYKQPKKLGSISIDKLYKELKKENNKKISEIKPNLNTARKRSNSSCSNESTIDSDKNSSQDGFIKPKKTTKTRKAPKTESSTITTNNSFDPLNSQDTDYSSMEIESAYAVQQSSTNTKISQKSKSTSFTKTKNIKPPPIYVYEQSMLKIIEYMKEMKIKDDEYSIKEIDDNTHIINTTSDNHHQLVINAFKDLKILNYIHTLVKDRPKSLLLKGIKQFSADYILKELKNLSLPNVEILKVSPVTFKNRNDHSESSHLLVQVTPDSDVTAIKKINLLAHQRIKWEKLLPKSIYQCKNCQRVGHTSSQCALPYRCVKCNVTHQPGGCAITEKIDKNLLYCVNCDDNGYPANYNGCPFIKFAIKVQKSKKNQSNQRSTIYQSNQHHQHNNKNYRYVFNKLSYANVTSNTHNKTHPNYDTNKQQSQSYTDNPPITLSALSNMFDSFKQELLKGFSDETNKVKEAVNLNTNKTDFLFKHLKISYDG